MDGVKSKAIEAVVPQPHEGVIDEESADLVTVGLVEIDRLAPGRVVLVGEVGPISAEVVPVWAEVIVDNVQQRRETTFVAGVYEGFEIIRRAVGGMRCEEADAVVAPAAAAGKLGNRHELDVGNTEVCEVVQSVDGGEEGAFLREGADVQFVDDRPGEWLGLEACRPPTVGGVVDDLRKRVDAGSLLHRARVGHRFAAVEGVGVLVSGLSFDLDQPPAIIASRHGMTAAVDTKLNHPDEGCPDFKHPHEGRSRSSRATGRPPSSEATLVSPSKIWPLQ